MNPHVQMSFPYRFDFHITDAALARIKAKWGFADLVQFFQDRVDKVAGAASKLSRRADRFRSAIRESSSESKKSTNTTNDSSVSNTAATSATLAHAASAEEIAEDQALFPTLGDKQLLVAQAPGIRALLQLEEEFWREAVEQADRYSAVRERYQTAN